MSPFFLQSSSFATGRGALSAQTQLMLRVTCVIARVTGRRELVVVDALLVGRRASVSTGIAASTIGGGPHT